MIKEIKMNKEKAFIEVKELLTKNGIEFTVSEDGDTITAKAGKIVQWFHFTENTISVASSVLIDGEDIETSRFCRGYKDVEEFCFDGDLWIRGKGMFEYTIIALKQYN